MKCLGDDHVLVRSRTGLKYRQAGSRVPPMTLPLMNLKIKTLYVMISC